MVRTKKSNENWKYHTFQITQGKFDGALIRIPTFLDNPDITPEMLGLPVEIYNEFIDFYTDVLYYIYGQYAIKKHSKKITLIKHYSEIRFPTWLNEYLKLVKESGKFLRDYGPDEANQLAIILGIRNHSSNLTPINNTLFDIMEGSE